MNSRDATACLIARTPARAPHDSASISGTRGTPPARPAVARRRLAAAGAAPSASSVERTRTNYPIRSVTLRQVTESEPLSLRRRSRMCTRRDVRRQLFPARDRTDSSAMLVMRLRAAELAGSTAIALRRPVWSSEGPAGTSAL